jgi:tripartite-type tricarboxylate transporter receptor subunit TctC
VATQPLVVLSSTELPVQDLAGLIRYAKERPDQLNFASAGIGSLGHLVGVLLPE